MGKRKKRPLLAPPEPKPMTYAQMGLFAGPLILAPYMGYRATTTPVTAPLIGNVQPGSEAANVAAGVAIGTLAGMTMFYRLFETIDAWKASPEERAKAPAENFLLRYLPPIGACLGIVVAKVTTQSDGAGLFSSESYPQLPEAERIAALAMAGAYTGATVAVRVGKEADVILSRLYCRGPMQDAHSVATSTSSDGDLELGLLPDTGLPFDKL